MEHQENQSILKMSNAFLEAALFKARRCWFIQGDGSEFSNFIIRSIYEYVGANAYGLLLIWNQNFKLTNWKDCEGFIQIQMEVNITDLSYKLKEINSTAIVDTKVLFITENINQVNSRLINLFKTTYLNVLVIKITKNIFQNIIVEQNMYEIENYELQAPCINLTIVVNENSRLENMHENYNLLDEIFKKQAWRPSVKDSALRILIKLYPPFSIMDDKGGVSSFEYHIAKGACDTWKTSVTTLEQAGLKVDINNDTGGTEWHNQAIEDYLLAGRADIALCSSCLPNFSNIKIVGSLFIYEITETSFMVPKPRAIDSAAFLIISINKHIWICFIASFFITQYHLRTIETPYRNIEYCFISFLQVVSGHGTHIPQSQILRVVLCTWILCSMLGIITTFYSTGYSSYLTERKYESRIKTSEDLVKIDGMKVSEISHHEANTLIKIIMSTSHDIHVRELTKRFDPFPAGGWNEVERRLKTGKRALYVRYIKSKYLIDPLLFDNRDFREFMQPMDVVNEVCHLNIVISPRSPYLKLVRKRLYYAMEHGLIKHWIDQFMNERKELIYDKNIRKQPPRVLSIIDLRGAFIFLLSGLLIAGLFFLAELLIKYHRFGNIKGSLYSSPPCWRPTLKKQPG